MSDVEFVDGLRVFAPRDGAPEFVKANIVICKADLVRWLNGRTDDEVRLDVKESRGGKWYAAVNSYRPRQTEPPANTEQESPQRFRDDEIPF